MVPSCPYIYAFIHGIILPNSSTFKSCTFSPIRMQSTHQQDFCSSANVGKRTCRNCTHSVFYGPEFSQQPCWGLNLFFQSSPVVSQSQIEKRRRTTGGRGEDGKERKNLQRGHKSAGEQKRGGVGPGLLTWWPCLQHSVGTMLVLETVGNY